MIKISNIKIPIQDGFDALRAHVVQLLSCQANEILDLQILKRSIDARKKPDIFYIYTVAVALADEAKIMAHKKSDLITAYHPNGYHFPFQQLHHPVRPVIIGSGPAGLFAALSLTEAGLRPILLERGAPIEQRIEAVETF